MENILHKTLNFISLFQVWANKTIIVARIAKAQSDKSHIYVCVYAQAEVSIVSHKALNRIMPQKA